MNIFHSELGS